MGAQLPQTVVHRISLSDIRFDSIPRRWLEHESMINVFARLKIL